MKRRLALILILTLTLTFIPGCAKTVDEDLQETLSDDIQAEYDALLLAFEYSTDVSDMEKYLCRWAESHNIKVSYDKYHNVIMSKQAVETYEQAESTVLQCTLSLDDLQKRCKSIATALYIMNNAEAYGFLRVIFTADEDGDLTGARKISSNYIQADNLISLDYDRKNTLFTASAGSTEYTMNYDLSWQAPSYYKAYEISIQGLVGGNSSDLTAHPNPIRTIGDLLATSMSNSILFELASFNGGITADTYPQAATAVVIIMQNDITRFTKRVESSQSRFEDRYLETNPNYTYTFTEVDMPDKVLSHDDCSNLVSFLYTMINGTYLKSDEGYVVASTNTGAISTYTGKLLVNVEARSLLQETMDEISNVFDTICGLSNFEYDFESTFPVWETEETTTLESKLQTATAESFGKEAKVTTTMENTTCSILKSRNPNLNIVGYGITEEDFIKQTEGLLYYLRDLNISLD